MIGCKFPRAPISVRRGSPSDIHFGRLRKRDFNLARDHPAKPEDVIVVHLTGLGAVGNPVSTGAPALADASLSPILWQLRRL